MNFPFNGCFLNILHEDFFLPPGSEWQRWEEMPFYHQVLWQKLWDPCAGQKEEAGVDSRCFISFSSGMSGCLLKVSVFSPNSTSAVHSCIQLRRLGLTSPHHEARRRRREVRQRQQAEEEELAERMKELQAANERKQRELEDMRMVCTKIH